MLMLTETEEKLDRRDRGFEAETVILFLSLSPLSWLIRMLRNESLAVTRAEDCFRAQALLQSVIYVHEKFCLLLSSRMMKKIFSAFSSLPRSTDDLTCQTFCLRSRLNSANPLELFAPLAVLHPF
jgi:hypothetical protein